MRSYKLLALVVAVLGVPLIAVAQPCPVNVPHVDGQWATRFNAGPSSETTCTSFWKSATPNADEKRAEP